MLVFIPLNLIMNYSLPYVHFIITKTKCKQNSYLNSIQYNTKLFTSVYYFISSILLLKGFISLVLIN